MQEKQQPFSRSNARLVVWEMDISSSFRQFLPNYSGDFSRGFSVLLKFSLKSLRGKWPTAVHRALFVKNPVTCPTTINYAAEKSRITLNTSRWRISLYNTHGPPGAN